MEPTDARQLHHPSLVRPLQSPRTGGSERLFRSPLPMPVETGNNRGPVSFRL